MPYTHSCASSKLVSVRSCTDQIASLLIILEQSLEWNSPLHINFVDHEKAFDSVDRQTLWKLLRHYRIPERVTNIIRDSYEGMKCGVVNEITDTEKKTLDAGKDQR